MVWYVQQKKRLSALKSTLGHEFKLITPGIRLMTNTNKTDDQSRVMTPIDAMKAGSDYLVIGRPVTQAADPLAVLQQIVYKESRIKRLFFYK